MVFYVQFRKEKISRDEYIISFEKNAILEMNSIEIDNIDLFGVLNQLFDFIFYDDKTYYEKLIIFRNVFLNLSSDKIQLVIKIFSIF